MEYLIGKALAVLEICSCLVPPLHVCDIKRVLYVKVNDDAEVAGVSVILTVQRLCADIINKTEEYGNDSVFGAL